MRDPGPMIQISRTGTYILFLLSYSKNYRIARETRIAVRTGQQDDRGDHVTFLVEKSHGGRISHHFESIGRYTPSATFRLDDNRRPRLYNRILGNLSRMGTFMRTASTRIMPWVHEDAVGNI